MKFTAMTTRAAGIWRTIVNRLAAFRWTPSSVSFFAATAISLLLHALIFLIPLADPVPDEDMSERQLNYEILPMIRLEYQPLSTGSTADGPVDSSRSTADSAVDNADGRESEIAAADGREDREEVPAAVQESEETAAGSQFPAAGQDASGLRRLLSVPERSEVPSQQPQPSRKTQPSQQAQPPSSQGEMKEAGQSDDRFAGQEVPEAVQLQEERGSLPKINFFVQTDEDNEENDSRDLLEVLRRRIVVREAAKGEIPQEEVTSEGEITQEAAAAEEKTSQEAAAVAAAVAEKEGGADQTEAPEISEIPNVTESPAEPEIPEETEAPAESETPEIPNVTEIPEETEVPEASEATAAPEEPEIAAAAEPVQQPAASDDAEESDIDAEEAAAGAEKAASSAEQASAADAEKNAELQETADETREAVSRESETAEEIEETETAGSTADREPETETAGSTADREPGTETAAEIPAAQPTERQKTGIQKDQSAPDEEFIVVQEYEGAIEKQQQEEPEEEPRAQDLVEMTQEEAEKEADKESEEDDDGSEETAGEEETAEDQQKTEEQEPEKPIPMIAAGSFTVPEMKRKPKELAGVIKERMTESSISAADTAADPTASVSDSGKQNEQNGLPAGDVHGPLPWIPFETAAGAAELTLPAYPESAGKRGLEGSVTIELTVGSSGRIAEAKIVSNTGHEIFADAVTAAVRTWKFPKQDQAFRTRKEFVFTMEDD